MDVYCPKCAEPVDNDEFHDRADEINSTYRQVTREFQVKGCEALGFPCNSDTMNSYKALAADAMYDLLGDDIDGAAAMMEDFEYMGLL